MLASIFIPAHNVIPDLNLCKVIVVFFAVMEPLPVRQFRIIKVVVIKQKPYVDKYKQAA